ncbi:MAG TPA: 3-hydroxyacyl-ACP dehydratase FabZ [Mesotoga infera]|uniref:3-hydroxyacyl-ACP dehydratase FabZ n=1 Tax=Mesotoga infera TaxID=1236046 RepID=A0A7C1H2Q1_9BACT|nr:3-hydroxyacyl-ACP dehydratase FabZ [Mesotoga infera]
MKDKEFVKSKIPHRDPFLLVDGVTYIGDSEIRAYRDLSEDDPIFEGHFPGNPVYPGVLMIEGIAQTAGILLLEPKKTPLFAGIEHARFKEIVQPPCRLEYNVRVIGKKMNIVKIEGVAYVEGKPCARATLLVSSL